MQNSRISYSLLLSPLCFTFFMFGCSTAGLDNLTQNLVGKPNINTMSRGRNILEESFDPALNADKSLIQVKQICRNKPNNVALAVASALLAPKTDDEKIEDWITSGIKNSLSKSTIRNSLICKDKSYQKINTFPATDDDYTFQIDWKHTLHYEQSIAEIRLTATLLRQSDKTVVWSSNYKKTLGNNSSNIIKNTENLFDTIIDDAFYARKKLYSQSIPNIKVIKPIIAKQFTPPVNKAYIYFYYENSYSIDTDVLIDNISIGRLYAKNYLPIEVSPGTYQVSILQTKEHPLSLTLNSGDIAYYRIKAKLGLNLNYNPTLERTSDSQLAIKNLIHSEFLDKVE